MIFLHSALSLHSLCLLYTSNLTNDEETLLNKGLKYNLPALSTNHLIHEVINAEAAIKSLLNDNMQNEARVMINNNLNRLLNMNTQTHLERKYLTTAYQLVTYVRSYN